MLRTVEQINLELRRHQTQVPDWQYHQVLGDLHTWAGRFIVELKLHTTTPAIMIDTLRSGTLGHHRSGRNGLGLRHEIAIRTEHLHNDAYWEVPATLLHELLHAEQEDVGKPGRRNYHNKQFRDRALGFGLIVDERGHQQYAPAPTPFLDLLEKYGIEAPELPLPTITELSPSASKLKPWVCGCTPRPIHIKVAISDLRARCLQCGQLFRPNIHA